MEMSQIMINIYFFKVGPGTLEQICQLRTYLILANPKIVTRKFLRPNHL